MTTELQELNAPVSVTLNTDAPVAVQAGIPAARNYADDDALRTHCESSVLGIVKRTKDRRKPLEDEWLAIQRLRLLIHDGGQKYKGRSNVYLPNYANAHNTILSNLSKGLFPSDDYMDVAANDFNGIEQAETVKGILKYELDCNAKLRQVIKPALSQLVDTGCMVIKYRYVTGAEFQGKKKKNAPPAFRQRPQKGLRVSARSIFNVVVYPETAENEDDVLITAEFIDLDRNFAIAMMDGGRWKNKDSALAQGMSISDSSQYARDQVVQDVAKIPGMTELVDPGDMREPIAQQVRCIEAYCNLRLPPDAYVEGERTDLPVPARITFINDVAVEITRNMNYDQKPPFLWGRQGLVPGSFYGSWAGRRARYLQYLINDLANQTNDTGIMGLNPFMIVDTNLLTGPLMPYAPGRIFYTRDAKNAIQFQHPPMEPIQYGQQMVNMYAGALVDGVGAPPVLQGVGKSGETATGQSILQRNALSPLQDVVEDLEAQVMVPLMERAWRLIVQFTDRSIPIQMPDGQMKAMDISDLDEFDYQFKFLSSSQSANQQVKSQQAIQLLQNLPAVMPLLQANGYMVNPAPILQKLYSDGFGWRQFDQFVFKMPQMMGPGGMPIDPSAMGAGAGVPGGGAVEPVAGPEQNAPQGQNVGEDVQGNGEFNNVRSMTDEINAMSQGRGQG